MSPPRSPISARARGRLRKRHRCFSRPPDRDAAGRTAGELADAGVSRGLASRVANLAPLVPALDLVEVAAGSGLSFEEATGVYFAIDDRLELHELRGRIAALPREERWEALARRALLGGPSGRAARTRR